MAGGDARKGARLRQVAAAVVDAVARGGRSLDHELDAREAEVGEEDRALLRKLCFGTVREYWQLEAWLGQLLDRPLRRRDAIVESLILLGLYQLSRTRIPTHAAVSATVDAVRLAKRPKLAGLVNAVLRRFEREEIAATAGGSEEARYNHPEWIIDRVRRDWPDDWAGILDENNGRGPMWLRVNPGRVAVADYERMLEDRALAFTRGPGGAIRLNEPVPVASLPGFAEGQVSVQDAAAQLAAPWLMAGRAAEPRILDACAAPGNKSSHLIECAGGAARLTAIDIDAERLESVRANFERLGQSATVLEADASNPGEWWNGEPFDRILLDAPCSASGVIRRHPDIKLLRRPGDIERLSALQARILEALWTTLRPGGRLLYVTCSIFAAENDAVVGRFLAATPDARENDVLPNNNIRDVMHRKTRGYQVLPGRGGLDGFYFACLEKRPAGDMPGSRESQPIQGSNA